MALDSLGFGIGLQARPKDYAGIAQQALATRSARQKAEAAAKARNDEEFNKLITSKDFIQQSGNFHKLYRGAASKEIADFMNRAVQARKDNPNDYLSTVVSDFQQTQLKLNSYKDNSEKVKAYEKAAFDPKLNATTWFDPNFTSSVINESFEGPSDWYKVKATPGLGISFDPETGDFDAQPRMKITDDEVIKDLSDTKNMQEISAKLTPTPGGGGKFKTAEVVSQVRPEVMENRARLWSNNPDYVTSKAIEMGVDMSDPNWFSKAQQLAYENVKNLSGQTKTELSVMTVPGSGTTTIVNQTPSVIPVDVAETVKVVSPSSFLRSGGPGGPNGTSIPGWNDSTVEIENYSKTDPDKAKKLKVRRDTNLKARANILSQAYMEQGGKIPKNITDVIAKQDLSGADLTILENFFKDKKFNTDDVVNIMIENRQKTFGQLSESDRIVLTNFVNYSSGVSKGQRKVVKIANIDDKSRIRNSDQDWMTEENGQLKTVSGRIQSIEQMDDGSLQVKVLVNGRSKSFPYTKFWEQQIIDKGYPQIKNIQFK